MKRQIGIFLVLLSLLIAGCASAPVAASNPGVQTTSGVENEAKEQEPELNPTLQPEAGAPAAVWSDLSAQMDEQGAVTVEIRPLNLDQPGETLDFEVRMDTHSVDLSMDLAALATLTTDTGRTVQAAAWDGGAGGHHVSGRLSFPARLEGEQYLDGARQITLTLVEVAAPERTFIWTQSLVNTP
jgi:hypothetical protein